MRLIEPILITLGSAFPLHFFKLHCPIRKEAASVTLSEPVSNSRHIRSGGSRKEGLVAQQGEKSHRKDTPRYHTGNQQRFWKGTK
jgi:hypothetical protein